MTSSTKPEVHKIVRCRRRRRTEAWPRVHVHKISRNFDTLFSRYDSGQTDTLVAILRTSIGGEVLMESLGVLIVFNGGACKRPTLSMPIRH